MSTRSLVAAIAACSIFAAPAFAEDLKTDRAIAKLTAQTATVNPAQRVCAQGDVTGSRISRKMCKSRAAWRKLGFDELADAK